MIVGEPEMAAFSAALNLQDFGDNADRDLGGRVGTDVETERSVNITELLDGHGLFQRVENPIHFAAARNASRLRFIGVLPECAACPRKVIA